MQVSPNVTSLKPRIQDQSPSKTGCCSRAEYGHPRSRRGVFGSERIGSANRIFVQGQTLEAGTMRRLP